LVEQRLDGAQQMGVVEGFFLEEIHAQGRGVLELAGTAGDADHRRQQVKPPEDVGARPRLVLGPV
jgi:hypothetical protein